MKQGAPKSFAFRRASRGRSVALFIALSAATLLAPSCQKSNYSSARTGSSVNLVTTGGGTAGNGGAYDGVRAVYLNFEATHPCPATPGQSAPANAEIDTTRYASGPAATLVRSQCTTLSVPVALDPAQLVPASGGALMYQGKLFVPSPLPAGALDLSAFRMSFDWEANDLNTTPNQSSHPGTWSTTLESYPTSPNLRALGNGDLECFMDSSVGFNPFTLGSGLVDLAASPNGGVASPCGSAAAYPYNSGALTTQGMFAQTYGYFEIRAELPQGAGMWPSFYLLPANGTQWPPELDILQAFGAANLGSGGSNQVHVGTHSTNASQQSQAWLTVPANIWTGYHAYGVDWEPDQVTYYFDGLPTVSFPTPSDYTTPMYIALQLEVGGSWAGSPAGGTGHLLLDYVRAFTRDPAQPAASLQPISTPDGGGYQLYGARTGP